EESGSWISIKLIAFSVLSQYVDIEPGTTLGRIFDMVDSDEDLKRFLGGYCGCDIDAVHKRPREGGEPIQVITGHEKTEDGSYRDTAVATADTVVIEPFYHIYTDPNTGERRLDGSHMLMAKASSNEDAGTTIHSQRDTSFGFLCGLTLRLNPIMAIAECD